MSSTNWGAISINESQKFFYFVSNIDSELNLDLETDNQMALNDTSSIYIYTNCNKDKFYIGQATQFSIRHNQHIVKDSSQK